MARIFIVTPARPGARTGNLHTARRWAAMLRSGGYRVSVATEWTGERCDVLVALHAKRSFPSVHAYRARHPNGPLVVALTGTDLYRYLPGSQEARASLAMADRLIALQEDARRFLSKTDRRKTRVVHQSSDARLRRSPPAGKFRVAVVGHLREEKDPLRAALALSHLRGHDDLEVVQVGAALVPDYARRASRIMNNEPRYRWLGSVAHSRALAWIARSHLLVVSSVMEGGANVICEAARIGTPVVASRVSGNVGMLGRNYPGYYPLFDDKALARLIEKASRDKKFYLGLKKKISARRVLFAPAAERAGLLRVLREAQSSVLR